MSDIPGFNPSTMTDDELMNKQVELNSRLAWASKFSGSNMSSQFLMMIQAIEAERRDRLLRFIFAEREKMFPDVIESEPELAAEHKRKTEGSDKDDAMTKRRKQGRERVTLTRTSSPTRTEPQKFPLHRDSEPTDDDDR